MPVTKPLVLWVFLQIVCTDLKKKQNDCDEFAGLPLLELFDRKETK